MNKLTKVLSLAFVLSFAVVSCSNGQEECKDGEKKECCAKKEGEAAEDEAKNCKPDCEKACCANKAEVSDSTEIMEDMPEEEHNHDDHDHEH